MFSFSSTGSFKNIDKFLHLMSQDNIFTLLNKYGQNGVDALRSATPVKTGITSESWYYTVESKKNKHSIIWRNSNVVDGIPVAILLQYGHATGTGGYVHGTEFINPAIQPIMKQIQEDVWKAVTSA